MFAPLKAIASDPALRVAALLLFLFGAYVCTIAPYQPLLAITVFGLSHSAYAALLVTASLVFVAASVILGILADQRLSRRLVAILSVGAYVLGTGLVWLAPGPASFVVAHALIMPCGASIFGQCFALARLAAMAHDAAARPGILAAVRAIFALPFVLVLPLWSLAFGQGATVLAVYPVLLVLSLAMAALILTVWPAGQATALQDRKSGLSFRASLREFAAPGLLSRVGLLGAVSGAVALYMTLIGLAFTAAGRGEGEVALFVGLVAGAEVPFMFALPLVQRQVAMPALIAVGTLIYGCHLALLPLLAATAFVWLLILPAALGGAAILTLPIAYLQDQMADRPGAGSSLLAFQRVAGDAVCALAFAIGTAVSGYGFAAAIGAALAVAAGFTLLRIDQRS